jgi:hypothetical protein
MPSEVTLSTEQKVLVHVQPMTEAGNVAPVDGVATFTVTSGTCTVAPEGQLSAYIVSGSDPGASIISASVDADLGAGVVPVVDTITATVTSATAESLTITIDAPVLK